jgi:hypothetical protein
VRYFLFLVETLIYKSLAVLQEWDIPAFYSSFSVFALFIYVRLLIEVLFDVVLEVL